MEAMEATMDIPYSKEAQDIRQKILEDYYVLENVQDEGLDRIVQLAAIICDCETAFISFIDWKDRMVRMHHRVGLSLEAAPIIPGETFCDNSVMSDGCFCLPDARKHPLYGKSRFVVGEPYVTFYFSVGLVLDREVGVPVGVLCVIDKVPRTLSEKQVKMMHLLAQDIVMHLQYKRTLRKSQEYVQELVDDNKRLERANTAKTLVANDLANMQQKMNSQFIATLGHELRTPTNIVQCSVLLLENTKLKKEQAEYVQMAQEGCRQLQHILDKSVEHMNVKSQLAKTTLVPFSLSKVIQELVEEHSSPKILGQRVLKFKLAEDLPEVLVGDCAKIFQILRYFLENAIKFTENDIGTIDIRVARNKNPHINDSSPSGSLRSSGGISGSLRSSGGISSGVSGNDSECSDNQTNEGEEFDNHSESGDNGTTTTCNGHTNTTGDELKSKEILYVDFSVCDNGIGVNTETYALLFNSLMQGDRSTTRIHGGMGLGLAISYDLAVLMNGSVRVASKHNGGPILCLPGNESDMINDRGSCFTLTVPLEVTSLSPISSEISSPAIPHSSPVLPAVTTELANLLPTLDPGVPSATLLPMSTSASIPSVDFPAITHDLSKQLKILVVEDNLLNQKVINHMLHKLGYKADCVRDGAKAVAKFSQTPTYNLILMDLHMPVMDGLTASRIIMDYARGLDKPTSIVAVTSSVSQEDRDNCKAIGMVGYLEKPISLNSLLSVLQSAEARAFSNQDQLESA